MSTTTAVGIPARAAGLLVILLAATAGCATKPAPEYGGRWKPVNRYAETPQEIPLHQTYLFQPAPMDGTLKTMLERWARDSRMALSYQHTSDFTLHAGVAPIRTNDLQEAVSQLSAAYGAQGIVVAAEGGQIVVRGVSSAASAPAADRTVAAP